MRLPSRLSEGAFDPATELAALTDAAPGAGAIVSFVGLARAEGALGPVEQLFLEHHPRLTQHSLDQIAQAARDRFAVEVISVVHRCGAVAPGKPIVFAGAAARHRRAAFEAADYLMDRLKTEAMFWKREDGPGGSLWIEPTDADRADRQRWE